MTIREYIIQGYVSSLEIRLHKLVEINAPEVVIQNVSESIKKAHCVKIGGDVEVLDDEFKYRHIKTGRNGKKYICINDNVNFFPNAKYGLYVKKLKE